MADSKKYNGGTWEHSLRKLTTATDTFTTLPVDIYADGNNATVGLKGNTVQNGTLTPDNPIMPQGTGERTGNLVLVSDNNCITYSTYDKFSINSDSTISITGAALFGFAVKVEPNTQYYYTAVSTGDHERRIREYSAKPTDWTTDFIIQSTAQPFTTSSQTQWILVVFYAQTAQTISNIMLNEGSTPLPYEPYGYKIPISNGQQTTNIYLGSTQTVRQIKKLVLTGREDWILASVNSHGIANFRYPGTIDDRLGVTGNVLSSHFTVSTAGNADATDESVRITNTGILYLRRFETDISTVTGLQTWLANQYANGTPVTVWYVLATPETAAVNEPLQKISDYADTLSNATSIPTTEGANTITVDTTVQPSKFSATWTGWHNASVKIKLENLFDSTNAQSGYLTSTGSVVEGHQNLRYTDYLSIPSGISNITQGWTDEGATLMNAPSMCFYTDNKTFISGEEFSNSNPKTFSVPVGAAYVRTCYRTFYTDIVLNEGNTPNWK